MSDHLEFFCHYFHSTPQGRKVLSSHFYRWRTETQGDLLKVMQQDHCFWSLKLSVMSVPSPGGHAVPGQVCRSPLRDPSAPPGTDTVLGSWAWLSPSPSPLSAQWQAPAGIMAPCLCTCTCTCSCGGGNGGFLSGLPHTHQETPCSLGASAVSGNWPWLSTTSTPPHSVPLVSISDRHLQPTWLPGTALTHRGRVWERGTKIFPWVYGSPVRDLHPPSKPVHWQAADWAGNAC